MKISNHGAVLNSDEITTLLDHLLEGDNSLPVCIGGHMVLVKQNWSKTIAKQKDGILLIAHPLNLKKWATFMVCQKYALQIMTLLPRLPNISRQNGSLFPKALAFFYWTMLIGPRIEYFAV